MKPRHQVSRAAIELIKRFEGYRPVAARLPDGRWTIGYGHTHTARPGAQVSEQDAEALLLYDLISISHGVDEAVYATLTQNQFDALCAFAFNLGLETFRRSAVLRRVNEGASIEAAFAMELWRKAEFEGETIVVDALVRRRAAEKLLFLTPTGAWTPAPSALLRPLLDDERDFTPREPARAVAPKLTGGQAEVVRVPEPAPEPEVAPPQAQESPVQAAAEQVSARLQTLFADARQDIPAFPVQAPQPAPVEPPPAELAPAPEQQPEFQPEPEPQAPDTPPEVDEYTPTRDLFEPELVEEEPAGAFVQARPRRVRRIGFGGVAALGLPGLVFFAGGAFWAVGGRGVSVGGPLSPVMVAALACVTGVLLIGIASYLLMQKLGQDAEIEGWRA
jgi:lysozyme